MRNERTRRLAASLTVLLLAASCSTVVAEEAAVASLVEGAAFEVPQSPEAVVVRYQQVLGKLEDADPGPSVTVYGNGRMVVHYPRYMKRAGDYEAWLGADQVDEVVASLVAKGFPELDTSTIAADVEEAAASQPLLVESSDATTTVIELHLESYRPSGETSEAPMTGLEKSVTWQGLRPQAQLFPGVDSLQRLAEAERELARLMEHEGLERVAE